MSDRILLYYITDRSAFSGDERSRRRQLLDKISEAAGAGVDYIQLREKDLSTRDLESLAQEATRILHKLRTENRELRTALLTNSRTDVALAAQAAGVHLRSQDITPQEVRGVWQGTRGADTPVRVSPPNPVISVSCHSPAEVMQAAVNQATLALFAPVFEKENFPGSQPTGLDSLHQACRAPIPVLALGGITLENSRRCLDAGAAGVAAIRLFQENEIAPIVRQLRTS